jgi:hypothetical protein
VLKIEQMLAIANAWTWFGVPGSRHRWPDASCNCLWPWFVVAAMSFGVVQLASSATGGDRCQDLLANEHRSDYISFDVEGCAISLKAPKR